MTQNILDAYQQTLTEAHPRADVLLGRVRERLWLSQEALQEMDLLTQYVQNLRRDVSLLLVEVEGHVEARRLLATDLVNLAEGKAVQTMLAETVRLKIVSLERQLQEAKC